MSFQKSGSGPALVLVHGGFGNSRTNWEFVEPVFRGPVHRVCPRPAQPRRHRGHPGAHTAGRGAGRRRADSPRWRAGVPARALLRGAVRGECGEAGPLPWCESWCCTRRRSRRMNGARRLSPRWKRSRRTVPGMRSRSRSSTTCSASRWRKIWRRYTRQRSLAADRGRRPGVARRSSRVERTPLQRRRVPRPVDAGLPDADPKATATST